MSKNERIIYKKKKKDSRKQKGQSKYEGTVKKK